MPPWPVPLSRRLVLASASVARRRLLEQAGFAPTTQVSGVNEEDLAEGLTADQVACTLAERKAQSVAGSLPADCRGAVVVGCDSVLAFEGAVLGKPIDADDAMLRWQAMRGGYGVLVTGHCVIDTARDGAEATAAASTVVHFGEPSDDEIRAYVATGEPLGVAGAFTLDGRSGPFIDSIEGDPSNVIGLSLPLFRDLLGELGVTIMELWA